MVVVDEEGHEVNVENLMASNLFATNLNDACDCTDMDTDEDDDSYDETSKGELFRKERKFPKFDANAAVPSFSLGMTFPDKSTFREAVIKYGLAERKVIKFVKNEATKCRAVCSWPNCPWVLHLSKASRAQSWQIATCKDVHTCPARRDNSLVTSRRIADKYEKFIKANPQWSIQSMRETIQEEMFANVSISKIKRAKSIVMQRMYDATKGDYAMMFDYQLELLRSNPGSTIVVKLDTEEPQPTFMRFYVCFDACKKGFLVDTGRLLDWMVVSSRDWPMENCFVH
jgi:alpha-galactosidase